MKEVLFGPVVDVTPKKISGSYKSILQVKELREKGLSQEAIAKTLDKPEAWVHGCILILDKLPEKVRQAIADQKFSRTAALQLLFAPSTKLEAIIDSALMIAETEGKL